MLKPTVPVPLDFDGVFAVQLNDSTPASETLADQEAALPSVTPVTNVFVPLKEVPTATTSPTFALPYVTAVPAEALDAVPFETAGVTV